MKGENNEAIFNWVTINMPKQVENILSEGMM